MKTIWMCTACETDYPRHLFRDVQESPCCGAELVKIVVEDYNGHKLHIVGA